MRFFERHAILTTTVLAGVSFFFGAELLAVSIVSGIVAGLVSRKVEDAR